MDFHKGPTLHVVVQYSHEDQAYLAHCLDFDLLGDGQTPEEALECLKRAIETCLEFSNRKGLSPFKRAPNDLWDIFYRAAGRSLRNEPAAPEDPVPYALAV